MAEPNDQGQLRALELILEKLRESQRIAVEAGIKADPNTGGVVPMLDVTVVQVEAAVATLKRQLDIPEGDIE